MKCNTIYKYNIVIKLRNDSRGINFISQVFFVQELFN